MKLPLTYCCVRATQIIVSVSKKSKRLSFRILTCAVLLLVLSAPAFAQTTIEQQRSGLLSQLAILQQLLADLQRQEGVETFVRPTAGGFVAITENVYVGSTDAGSYGNVTQVQLCLAQLGYYAEDVTGAFDSITEDAVRTFQLLKADSMQTGSSFLNELGYVGSATRGALNELCKKGERKSTESSFVYSGSAPLTVVFGIDQTIIDWPGGVVIEYGDGDSNLLTSKLASADALRHTYAREGEYTARFLGGSTVLKSVKIKVVGHQGCGVDDSVHRCDSSVDAVRGCYNAGQYEKVGATLDYYEDYNGVGHTVADTNFECQSDGTWAPQNSFGVGCFGLNKYHPAGSRFVYYSNNVGDAEYFAADSILECQSDGVWQVTGDVLR